MSDGDACPECGTPMNHKGASGYDHKNRYVGVTWDRCPECGTVVDDYGNVSTPEDHEQAMQEAREANRAAQEQRRKREERDRQRRSGRDGRPWGADL